MTPIILPFIIFVCCRFSRLFKIPGVVSIWAQNQVENWSAFAPDFKELDENVEYEERESEFDVEDEDRSIDMCGESRNDEQVEVCRVLLSINIFKIIYVIT